MNHFYLLIISGLIMMLLPLPLAHWLGAKQKASWRLFGVGVATFILSQVGHIPFNGIVATMLDVTVEKMEDPIYLAGYVIFLGLSAALFEESARYLTYRYWIPEARSWKDGMMLGAGHGGIEAIIIGLLVIASGIGLLALVDSGMADIPAETLPLVEAQIAEILNAPWYELFLGAFERLLAICLHLSLSLMVLRVFTTGQKRWYFLAVGTHATVNAVAVYLAQQGHPYLAEGVIGLVVLGCLGFIRYSYQHDQLPQPDEEEVPLSEIERRAFDPDKLTEAQYMEHDDDSNR